MSKKKTKQKIISFILMFIIIFGISPTISAIATEQTDSGPIIMIPVEQYIDAVDNNGNWGVPVFSSYTNFLFDYDNGEVTIMRYAGSETTVEIPATIEGCPVKKIYTGVFLNCTSAL